MSLSNFNFPTLPGSATNSPMQQTLGLLGAPFQFQAPYGGQPTNIPTYSIMQMVMAQLLQQMLSRFFGGQPPSVFTPGGTLPPPTEPGWNTPDVHTPAEYAPMPMPTPTPPGVPQLPLPSPEASTPGLPDLPRGEVGRTPQANILDRPFFGPAEFNPGYRDFLGGRLAGPLGRFNEQLMRVLERIFPGYTARVLAALGRAQAEQKQREQLQQLGQRAGFGPDLMRDLMEGAGWGNLGGGVRELADLRSESAARSERIDSLMNEMFGQMNEMPGNPPVGTPPLEV